ncbi:unnamed protein product [Cuscuta campestris]|uniref:Uncharacterized protein n=1 Tax=Cuscuta campestris TaxID=132261 RepID=A0A484MP21_9ASTE|nr:unnamed protein product [Cuscuta campestris]
MSHEELIASNAALKAQVEYLAKEVAKLTKMKLNELQGSDREEDTSSSGTVKPKTNEGSEFKVDIPTFEGKNDPDEFLEWLETVECVFDFKDVSNEKKKEEHSLKQESGAVNAMQDLYDIVRCDVLHVNMRESEGLEEPLVISAVATMNQRRQVSFFQSSSPVFAQKRLGEQLGVHMTSPKRLSVA